MLGFTTYNKTGNYKSYKINSLPYNHQFAEDSIIVGVTINGAAVVYHSDNTPAEMMIMNGLMRAENVPCTEFRNQGTTFVFTEDQSEYRTLSNILPNEWQDAIGPPVEVYYFSDMKKEALALSSFAWPFCGVIDPVTVANVTELPMYGSYEWNAMLVKVSIDCQGTFMGKTIDIKAGVETVCDSVVGTGLTRAASIVGYALNIDESSMVQVDF